MKFYKIYEKMLFTEGHNWQTAGVNITKNWANLII